MKKFLVIGVVIVTLSVMGNAWGGQRNKTICDSIASLAWDVMAVRQAGVSKADVIKRIKSFAKDKTTRKIALEMVTSAYKRPRWYTFDLQIQEVINFRDIYYEKCTGMLKK